MRMHNVSELTHIEGDTAYYITDDGEGGFSDTIENVTASELQAYQTRLILQEAIEASEAAQARYDQ